MSDPNERPPPLPMRPSTYEPSLSIPQMSGPRSPPLPPRPAGYAAPWSTSQQFVPPHVPQYAPSQAYVPSSWPNFGQASQAGTTATACPPALPARPRAPPPPLHHATASTNIAHGAPAPAPQYPNATLYGANVNAAAFQPPAGLNIPKPAGLSARIKTGLQDVERMFASLAVGQAPPVVSPPVAAPHSFPPSEEHSAPSLGSDSPSKPLNRFPTVGLTACVADPIAFSSTWYIHDDAPNFPVCSRCFEDHIRNSLFESNFKPRVFDRGWPSGCKFSKPRVKDQLFRRAVADGSLSLLVAFMKLRPTIADCRGVTGALGSEGIRWFRLKDQAIPEMVVCQACYEDHVNARHWADKFALSTTQPPDAQWACDMAVEHIQHEYRYRADMDDYPNFVQQVKRRLYMPACEKKLVVLALHTWYAPVNGPRQVLVCETCYCDKIVHTGEEVRWRRVGNMPAGYGNQAHCALGHFNVRIAWGRSEDCQDYSIFWHALHEIYRQPKCDPSGMRGANWYTLTSRPANFEICGACFAGIAEPAGLSSHFVRRTDVPSNKTLVCDFSTGSPRFLAYISKALEAYYLRDISPLESFLRDYANMPVCRRDEDFEDGVWYGWEDCTICPSCHHEFVKDTALASKMPLQGVVREGHTMCEMYSPRMRRLYAEACAQSPPNAANLLAISAERRTIYIKTMMVCRRMLIQQQIQALQAQTLGIQGSFYTNMGHMQSITTPSPWEYSMAGVGYGFANQNELTGAIYNKQSSEMSLNAMGSAANVGLLEQQWRAVE
ncbi:conserved hypothetical protein [Verticillium alfalfae VaMs.102]|uniref:Integral membrane protein n=1 Tax=Verticillium alfalfae (strain VaMs.102 / ATCC MYA-4576 / FGSC 10136) TaxID=526221 RepID=C9SJ37_VERA1|nr:conserved hypothetical protein [Verticillium alfalfae VaMs.102]EEY18960.1 conserved hypothetical protein [Verticillium alfalfae VaMs.102]